MISTAGANRRVVLLVTPPDVTLFEPLVYRAPGRCRGARSGYRIRSAVLVERREYYIWSSSVGKRGPSLGNGTGGTHSSTAEMPG